MSGKEQRVRHLADRLLQAGQDGGPEATGARALAELVVARLGQTRDGAVEFAHALHDIDYGFGNRVCKGLLDNQNLQEALHDLAVRASRVTSGGASPGPGDPGAYRGGPGAEGERR